MRSLAAIAFCLVCSGFSALAADETVASPRGTFTITQHRDSNWTAKLHLIKPGSTDITFTDDYPWPALFYISPDDQWILGVAGSQFNNAFLARHKQYQQERPDYFRDPSWPVALAEDTAEALNLK